MKVAVFDPVGNEGGGSRFCRALLLALRENYPQTQLTYFGSWTSTAREKVDVEFEAAGVTVRYLTSAGSPIGRHRLYQRILHFSGAVARQLFNLPLPHSNRSVTREIESLANGFDVALFPWPYLFECPLLECPSVGVFHDFNYKYFFGSPIYSDEQYRTLNVQIPLWLSRVTPVVSSRFTACELAKFYPEAASKIQIVHLAPFTISTIEEEVALGIVGEMGLKTPYILYPTNLCQHKNVGILLHAFYLLQQRGVNATLVITGPGTECATGTISPRGVLRSESKPDVLGLGYVSNIQIDALIQCASLVISTSLYEAGNGPGLDAWSKGVPVAMSDIPSFVEHLEVLGVEAETFNPYDAIQIADTIQNMLSDLNKVKASTQRSKSHLQKHTWKEVARDYHEVLKRVAAGG